MDSVALNRHREPRGAHILRQVSFTEHPSKVQAHAGRRIRCAAPSACLSATTCSRIEKAPRGAECAAPLGDHGCGIRTVQSTSEENHGIRTVVGQAGLLGHALPQVELHAVAVRAPLGHDGWTHFVQTQDDLAHAFKVLGLDRLQLVEVGRLVFISG